MARHEKPEEIEYVHTMLHDSKARKMIPLDYLMRLARRYEHNGIPSEEKAKIQDIWRKYQAIKDMNLSLDSSPENIREMILLLLNETRETIKKTKKPSLTLSGVLGRVSRVESEIQGGLYLSQHHLIPLNNALETLRRKGSPNPELEQRLQVLEARLVI